MFKKIIDIIMFRKYSIIYIKNYFQYLVAIVVILISCLLILKSSHMFYEFLVKLLV
ncbi:hypothetical protein AB837_00187 [bacterium AB1]|nr:hypothetical protein AB837_00187 [bacterium AB1]